MKKRIFSGAQPTGELQLGNYIGALRNWVALQDEYESFYCIVDLHAITIPRDPQELRQKTLDLARVYLAAGLDPERCTIFIQSDVSEHAELAWIMNCVARIGELERMTQYKDKARVRGENVSAGLLVYPTLMAADILLYQTNLVPIGQDQKQHLELTRDVAERFNRDYGETFVIPDGYFPPVGAKIMSLAEPERKMSKSDENLNASIFLKDDADTIIKKFKRAVTDSQSGIVFDPERKGLFNLLTIYQAITGKSPEEIESHFEGKGYGHLKTELGEAVVEYLRPFHTRMAEIDDGELEKILQKGAEKAGGVASETLKSAYERLGLHKK
jgi:tryptophanyl-tRNA synthetase